MNKLQGINSAFSCLWNLWSNGPAKRPVPKVRAAIGDEFDVYTWFELNRHLNLGVGMGHLMPGTFVTTTTTGPTYTYPYFAINFKDNGSRGGN